MSIFGKLRRALFGIPSAKAVFSRPGFAKEAWLRFQPVAHSLVEGYHASLEDSRIEVLGNRLDRVDKELRGFAYEGAGMGLAALDLIAPWKKRLSAFVDGPGAPYIYPIYVGVGLALARMHRQPERYLQQLDPVLCWVIVDGYGFHEGFFRQHQTVNHHGVPKRLSAYARRIFDQGVGRSIWFANGAQVERVHSLISAFAEDRRADLWSGVGLASAYAGGASKDELVTLTEKAKFYLPQLARGAAIAAKGRIQADNLAAHTEMACQLYCGISSREAAHMTDLAREGLTMAGVESAYELWRQGTQARLAVEVR